MYEPKTDFGRQYLNTWMSVFPNGPFNGRFRNMFQQTPTYTPMPKIDITALLNPIYTQQQPDNSLAPLEMYKNYKGLLNMGDK